MQPLGRALEGAMNAGDGPAVTAALRKLSAGLPGMLDAPALAASLHEFVAALEGGGEIKNGRSFDPDKHPRGGKGRFVSKPVKDWKPDESLPGISSGEARTILGEGRVVTDPRGVTVKFDRSLEEHWTAERKEAWDISRRLGHLPEAIRTVENPHEVWRDGGTTIYLHRHGPKEGMTAFVEILSGKAATYYPAEHFAKLQAKLNQLANNPANLLWSRETKGGRD